MMRAEQAGGASKTRVADLVQSGASQAAAIERAPGVWESRGIGNSYLLTTAEGSILINAGTLRDARIGVRRFADVSAAPIRFIILTQSHANQYGGLEVYKTPENEVLAHYLYSEERAYNAALLPHYMRGSRRFFGTITGSSDDLVPTKEVTPDVLVEDGHEIEVGGRRLRLVWTPGGETQSAMVVWLPEERLAIVGNLFGPLFGNHPNLNTLRGDKPRSALEFVDSVRRLRDLGPEMILTGHEVIEGAEHIRAELTRIADAVEWAHDATIAGMNEGADLPTLMREIKMPSGLELTEEYGKLAWNVRAIWHHYSGWFDPSRGTPELYGVPLASIATDVVELAGGAGPIARRADKLVEEGRPIEALHLLDLALAAEPEEVALRTSKVRALALLDEQTGGQNLWERMWIATERRKLEASG